MLLASAFCVLAAQTNNISKNILPISENVLLFFPSQHKPLLQDCIMQIRTNHQFRPVILSHELTQDERKEFDYIDWKAVDEGFNTAEFFRYKGQLYDLGEFMGVMASFGKINDWHVYHADSYFSGLLVKFSRDCESVKIGQYFC